MNQSLYSQQERNVFKTWSLMAMFLVIIIGLGWFFGAVYNQPQILYVAVIFSLVMNVGSYWFSDKLVLSMSGARKIEKQDNPELWNLTENLCITAGMKMPKLYIIDDSSPNAFATGRNEEHGAVAVTTGLLSILDRAELEGVIAHELAHIKNKDILLSTVVVVLVGFIALISDFFLRMSFFGGSSNDDRGDGRLKLILAIVGLVLAILAPIVATLIQLAISRKREFLADASGALLTRYPEGLAHALEKINQHPKELKRANHATAHLFIANPFKGKHAVGFMAKLFMTHPPVEERVKALRGFNV